MGREIERKFLIDVALFRRGMGEYSWQDLSQGYICSSASGSTRIRIAGDRAYLTLKGPVKGISRLEYEYEIPLKDGAEMLKNLCTGVIEKRRYFVPYGGRTWEVDEFYGANLGLYIAEIELSSESEEIDFPPFIGREVTGDKLFYNGSLVRYPFSGWRTRVPEYS